MSRMIGDAHALQRQEKLAGLLLIAAAAIALLLANSNLSHTYDAVLDANG